MENDITMIEEQATKIRSLVHGKVPPDDFDDVMQDIRLSFLVSLPLYRGEAKIETYAYSIARRRICDYWRKAYRGKKEIKAATENYHVTSSDCIEEGNGARFRPAEKQVFKLLGMGMNNDEMAAALFRTKDTVRSHLKSIYKKLQCNDRTKVALLANKIFKEETE